MPNKILHCEKCHIYTLKEKCPKCSSKTLSKIPAKFSPEDRFGNYRRKYKKNVIQDK
jgi:H/ACA ribonucleoprotein complex subunit 3